MIIIAALGFIYIWKNCTKIREGLYPCQPNDWTGGASQCCPVRDGKYSDLREGGASQLGQAIADWCKNPTFITGSENHDARMAFGCDSETKQTLGPPYENGVLCYPGAPPLQCDENAWENNGCDKIFDQEAQKGIGQFYPLNANSQWAMVVAGTAAKCNYAPEAYPRQLALGLDTNFCEGVTADDEHVSQCKNSNPWDRSHRQGGYHIVANMDQDGDNQSLAAYLQTQGFGSVCNFGDGTYGRDNTLKTGNCPPPQTCTQGTYANPSPGAYDGTQSDFQEQCCVAGRDGDDECRDKADGTPCTGGEEVHYNTGGADKVAPPFLDSNCMNSTAAPNCPVSDRKCKNGYCCSRNACQTCSTPPLFSCCRGRNAGDFKMDGVPNVEYPATWPPPGGENNSTFGGICGLDGGGLLNDTGENYTDFDLAQTLQFCGSHDTQGINSGACFGYAWGGPGGGSGAGQGSRPGTWYQQGDSEKCCTDNPLPSTPCSCGDWGLCTASSGTCGPGTRTRTCTPATGDGTSCSQMGGTSQSCTVKCQNCPYSAFSDPVVPGKTGSPCLSAGGTLNPGGSCSLACAPGYTPSTSTYKCSTEGTLSGVLPTCTKKKCTVLGFNKFVIPDSTKTTPCEVGKVLETGETCYVTCEQGYEAASGSGVYSCSSNGTYTPGNLTCKKKLCPPIPKFNTNTMVGGPDPPCTQGEQLAPTQTCNISCKAAYNSTGSGTYTCGPDATFTTHSTLQCSAKTCVIPPFGDGIIAGPTPSCKVGEKLAEGANCNVMCKTGYTHTGSGVYSCSEDGQLTEASLSCTPPNPTCALDFKCPVNQHLKNPLPTTPCASSTCVAGDCCIDNPQCSTLKSCNAGRRFKQNHENIICPGANCEDTDCCEAIPQPTCQGYPCPTHYSILADADTIKCAGATCQDPECCVAKSKPTCVDDPILCPQGYDSKPNIEDITCKGYQCNAADCCIGRPPTPPPPNIIDVTQASRIDNRKWINNTQRIRKFNVEDDRHQTMVQSDPSFYYDDFEIRGGRYRGDNAYPPTTIIVSDDRELELPWRDNDRLY